MLSRQLLLFKELQLGSDPADVTSDMSCCFLMLHSHSCRDAFLKLCNTSIFQQSLLLQMTGSLILSSPHLLANCSFLWRHERSVTALPADLSFTWNKGKKRIFMDVRRQNVCLVVIFCHLVECLSVWYPLALGSTAEIFRYSFSSYRNFYFQIKYLKCSDLIFHLVQSSPA